MEALSNAAGHFAFCCQGLGPHVPLKAGVSANQYKVLPTDHVYPMRKHFSPDLSRFVSSRMALPQSMGHKGSVNGLRHMKIK